MPGIGHRVLRFQHARNEQSKDRNEVLGRTDIIVVYACMTGIDRK